MAGISERIYNISPVLLQNIGVSAYGLTWRQRRFGGVFKEELARFKDRENFSQKQWNHYQTVELRKLLVFAFENNPYYHGKFSRHGFTLDYFQKIELEDLGNLPLLEKNELRQYGTNTLLSLRRDKDGKFFASSGSTGTPTQIMISTRMHQVWSAGFEARIRNWAGLTHKMPRGTIGGRRVVPAGISEGPYYRYNLFEKQVYFSAYHISEKTADDYVSGQFKFGVEYMTGYAMSNFFLARFIEEKGIKAPPLKAVITSSEKLTPEMRNTFNKVYGCRTYDSYSGVEACGMISECEYGNLHISPDLGIVEILNEDGKSVKPGEVGEIICTGLLNFDQPLIRYRIGDLVRLSKDQNCKCGRKMPVVDEIVGRLEDSIIGPDGREMVRFHGIFVGIPRIIEAQVVQHELQRFEIKIVADNALNLEYERLIRKRMESQLGEIELEINYVTSMPKEASGKFKSVVSHVKRDTTNIV